MAGLELLVNKRVEITKEKEIYKSIIQDIEDTQYKISIPVNNGVYLSFTNGEEVNLRYYKDELGCYAFSSKVVERVVDNNLHLYKLSEPYNIRKIQRRNFVRVNTIEYAFFCKVIPGETIKWAKGLIVDLSGGGMKLKIREHIKLGENIIVNLIVNDEKLSIKGTVVRAEKTEDKEYMCGIEFVDLAEKDRDKIISKVFKQMRKQRGVL